MSDSLLRQYVIYDHPRDYPDYFVVRAWEINSGIPIPLPFGNPVLTETLDEARAAVPVGFVNIGRFEEDDPVIVEVWT
jgi:hypothetical protein